MYMKVWSGLFVVGGLDLVVVPGVAFTAEGYRLGHGRGYYDQYLTKLRKAQTKPVVTIGMAFTEQIVEDLPVDNHDVKLDYVLYTN